MSSNDGATVLGPLVVTDPEVRDAAIALRDAIAQRQTGDGEHGRQESGT